jgi:hypothetical protein
MPLEVATGEINEDNVNEDNVNENNVDKIARMESRIRSLEEQIQSLLEAKEKDL